MTGSKKSLKRVYDSSSPATAPTQAQDEAEPCDEDEKSVMEDEEEKEKKP